MGKKVYFKNLSWSTLESNLEDECSQYGKVTDTRIIKDRDTGRSRGFGFVTFENDTEADNAIRKMHGVELDGRVIGAELAIDKRDTRNESINS